MAHFRPEPECLKQIGKHHRIIADCQIEIDYRIQNPEPAIEGIDFNDINIRFLRLKIRDNVRILGHLWDFA